MPTPFTGAGFTLESVTQVAAATVRVRYLNDPLAVSSAGANDSLNPANYTLSGPSANDVESCATVSGDPQAIDLELSAPLIAGSWTLAVSNVETAGGDPLEAPTSLTFAVTAFSEAPPLSLGATNYSSEDLLRKHLSPVMKGPGWDALITALAVADSYRNEVAQSAFDQLFKSTASGIYLDRRAADDGFSRPDGIGISDEIFRKLAIKTTARKQVIQVLQETLEAYYGSEATRAHTTSTAFEPYILLEDDTLLVQTDGGQTITVSFERDDFAQLGAATAAEVAAAITREFSRRKLTGYAVEFVDPAEDETYIRIFSGSLGLSGSVAVRGGRAQNVFLFPTDVHPTSGDGPQATTQFTITPGTGINGVDSGKVRFTFIGGTNPDLQEVLPGDYVNIFGTVFDEELHGTYTVSAVTTTYFEIVNSSLDWAASATLLASSDMRFYRPTTSTILSTGRMATATQGDPSVLDIILPATTQAVTRTPTTGAYLHSAEALEVESGARTDSGTVTVTITGHGLTDGQLAFVDGVYPDNFTATPPAWVTADAGAVAAWQNNATLTKLDNSQVLMIPGDGTTNSYLYNPDTNTWSAGPALNVARTQHAVALLTNGRVLVAGGGVATCEVYDYVSNTFTTTGSMTTSRSGHALTLLNNGKVLASGGAATAELYTALTGTWAATAAPAATHTNHVAVKLGDGRVLVAGGGTTTVEVYNPINDTWRTGTAAPASYTFQRAILLPNDLVFIAGGTTNGNDGVTNTYLFNPMTLAMTAGPAMTTARFRHAMVTMSSGLVMVAGGQVSAGVDTATVETYSHIQNAWTAGTSLSQTKDYASAVVLDDNQILLNGIGGSTNYSILYTLMTGVIAAGGLNGLFEISVIDPDTISWSTPDFPYATTLLADTGEVTPIAATTNGIQGPFIYDTTGGSAITAVETTLSEDLVTGNSYTVINVADASDFPDEEGYLAFGFGTSDQLTPVRYLGRISSTLLLLDPSFILPSAVPSGASVTLLAQRGGWTPDAPETVGTFYLTAAAAGRVAASATIDSLVAAGVRVEKNVVYPSDVGLGNAGSPAEGAVKISDKVVVWGGDDIDEEIAEAREE